MSDLKLPQRVQKGLAGLSAIAFAMAVPLASSAEDNMPANGNADHAPVQSEQALLEGGRYSLAESDGDILRVDRKTGTVSFCRKSGDAWRCMPAPVAEDAYQADIAQLDDEVDRLKAHVLELEARIAALQPETDEGEGAVPSPETERAKPVPRMSEPAEPGESTQKPAPNLSEEDEHQLKRMMDFSEKAMRRFFGLMRDLQTEFSTK